MPDIRCDHCGLVPEERGERMIVVDGIPHCEECAKFWTDARLLGAELPADQDLS
jgi:hypothetical protein